MSKTKEKKSTVIWKLSKLEQFEEWLEKHPRLESVYDFFKYDIWRRIIEDNYYEVKYFLQRIFRGYSDRELWDISFPVYKTAFRLIVPFKKELLEQIKLGEKGGYGIPVRMSEKRWLYIIDEIIFFLDEIINDTNYPYPPYEYKWIQTKKGSIGKELGTKKQIKEYKEKLDNYLKRLANGKKLFHKYLHYLGD